MEQGLLSQSHSYSEKCVPGNLGLGLTSAKDDNNQI